MKAVASNLAGVTRTLVHPLPEDGPIVLQLPVLGRLEGQLLSTEGFDWSSIRLAARLVQEDGTYGPSARVVQGQPEGAFELAGLPVGNLVFVCSLIDSTLPYGDRESLLVSESVEIVGGTQRWELDLRRFLPATCAVSLSLDGKPYSDVRVVLVSQKRIERYGERAGLRQVLGHEATTDVDGRAEITGLKAERHTARLRSTRGDSWIAPIGLVEGASYGRPARLRASLELVEREVLVRSASGELFLKSSMDGRTAR